MFVLYPRYIKIIYVPQQRYYDTSFKVWSDPKTTMPAKMAGSILTYAFPHHEHKYHELSNILNILSFLCCLQWKKKVRYNIQDL
jgi:hypothetical protein